MLGLSTAWHLLRHDVEVSVVDRAEISAGASDGNAGWLTPALALPLAEPALLKAGPAMMLDPNSPLYVPPRPDPRLARFLIEFARHCTPRRWRYAASALGQASRRMQDSYDELIAPGPAAVAADVKPADPFLAVFSSAAAREGLLDEFRHLEELGFTHRYSLLDGAQAREINPIFGDSARFAVAIEDQRFINPSRFVHALGAAVTAGGGQIQVGRAIDRVEQRGSEVVVSFADRSSLSADAAVIATGSRLDVLARRHGVRKIVQAGRGYSFTVHPQNVPANPFYLPAQRVACTPLGGPADGLRVCGTMEFRPPDAPLDQRRIDAIVTAASTMLDGVDWSARSDEWVGARPCTSDGLPLVGRTMSDRVFVAGGHGMWGIALGPLTGKLLAQQVATGEMDSLLLAFDPLRP